jgi:hypothetical protein
MWAFWPLGDSLAIFLWLSASAVFAAVVGMFMQATVDLLRAHRAQKLHWLEYAFLMLIISLAVAYGYALFYFPPAEVPLRYGLVGGAPLLIAQLYARSRFFILRRGSPKV